MKNCVKFFLSILIVVFSLGAFSSFHYANAQITGDPNLVGPPGHPPTTVTDPNGLDRARDPLGLNLNCWMIKLYRARTVRQLELLEQELLDLVSNNSRETNRLIQIRQQIESVRGEVARFGPDPDCEIGAAWCSDSPCNGEERNNYDPVTNGCNGENDGLVPVQDCCCAASY